MMESRETEHLLNAKSRELATSKCAVNSNGSRRGYTRQVLLAAVATLSTLSAGITFGFTSPTSPQLQQQGHLSGSTQMSWFGSVMNLGCAAGSLLGGWTLEKEGRRPSLIFSALPTVLGYIVFTCIPYVRRDAAFTILLLSRVFTGIGAGIATSAFGVYVSETAHPEIRGMLVMGFQLGSTSGILLIYSLGLALNTQWLGLAASVPPTLLALWIYFLPETPRFLLKNNRKHEAQKCLSWLRDSDDVDAELSEIESVINDTSGAISWTIIFSRQLRTPILLSLALIILQQLCGINAIIFYTQTIFEQAGWTSSPQIPAVIVAAVKVLMTWVTVYLIDRAGRRKLFIISGVLLTLSLTAMGVYFYLTEALKVSANLSYMSLACILLYVIGYAIGWGPVPWIFLSEVIPLQARGPAVGLAVFVCNMCSFLVTVGFLPLQSVMTTSGVFWLFAGICLLGTAFAIARLPETKGKSLEEIEHLLTKEI